MRCSLRILALDENDNVASLVNVNGRFNQPARQIAGAVHDALDAEGRLVVPVENQVLVERRLDSIGMKSTEFRMTEMAGTSKFGMSGQPVQRLLQGCQIPRSHRFTGVASVPSGLPLKVLDEPGRALQRQNHRFRWLRRSRSSWTIRARMDSISSCE